MNPYVIVCLGVGPIIFGPFVNWVEAENALSRHMHDATVCKNGIERDDHAIERIRDIPRDYDE